MTMATRHGKRLCFASALKNGLGIPEASRLASITAQTGRVWKKQIEAGAFDSSATLGASLTKEETARLAAEIARNTGEDAAKRIHAMNLSAELGGHKAPARSLVEVRTVPRDVIGWLDSTYGALPAAAPMPALESANNTHIPPGDPPTDSDGDVLPPLTNSTKSGESVDATSEVVLKEGSLNEHSSGDCGGQAAEAGGGNRARNPAPGKEPETRKFSQRR